MFDFVITDENLAEILNTVDYEFLMENMFSYQKLVNLNIPLERASEDNTRHNNYGVKLIEMRKRSAMFIANGRLFKDQNIGRMTCKESSIVYYLILPPEAFKIIAEFLFLDINPMFSDIHKHLHFVGCLNEYAPLQNEKIYVQHNHIRWNENKADEFRQALMDSVLLGEINTALDNLIDSNCITADQENTIVNHLGSLYIHSATSAFGISKK